MHPSILFWNYSLECLIILFSKSLINYIFMITRNTFIISTFSYFFITYYVFLDSSATFEHFKILSWEDKSFWAKIFYKDFFDISDMKCSDLTHYIHAYIHSCIHTFMHTYIHAYIHVQYKHIYKTEDHVRILCILFFVL